VNLTILCTVSVFQKFTAKSVASRPAISKVFGRFGFSETSIKYVNQFIKKLLLSYTKLQNRLGHLVFFTQKFECKSFF